jgi:hypothetical protein
VDDQEFERARYFKCLGSFLIEDFIITMKIIWRTVIANQTFYGGEETTKFMTFRKTYK